MKKKRERKRKRSQTASSARGLPVSKRVENKAEMAAQLKKLTPITYKQTHARTSTHTHTHMEINKMQMTHPFPNI